MPRKKLATNPVAMDTTTPSPGFLSSIGIVSLSVFVLVSFAHYHHISTLFENSLFFSHLSTIEREMAFRTDAGFYYSYFKTTVRSSSFLTGLKSLINDTGTEYPSQINSLRRFNVYPEVMAGAVFRVMSALADRYEIPIKTCYQINRGHGMPPVPSCDGIGDEAVFYTTVVFLVAGGLAGCLYFAGEVISGSRLGGLLTVTAFIFNHGECTRVMWTPPLRENFSFPFLILQVGLLSRYFKGIVARDVKHENNTWPRVGLVLATLAFVLPWQFSQFVLLTQNLSLFGTHALGFAPPVILSPVINAVFLGYSLGTILQFFNPMLISSLYVSSYIALHVVLYLDSLKNVFPSSRTLKILIKSILFALTLIGFKITTARLLDLSDDAHIFNILKAKFSDYQDFDTLLYVCSKEFDFLPLETVLNLVQTLLLPTAGLVVLRVLYLYGKAWVSQTYPAYDDRMTKEKMHQSHHGENHEEEPKALDTVMLYHVFQLFCFTFMAAILMRLKLFMTPYLCIIISLVTHNIVLPQSKASRFVITSVLIGAMAIQGSANIAKQRSRIGEYNNAPQEELFEWILHNTSPNAVFAGTMPVMANLKLSTGRNIVNHPHYEDLGLRERTKIVYQLFSRKQGKEVYEGLRKLQVEYAILDRHWCINNRPKTGCAIPEIWDVLDPDNAGKPTFCSLISSYRSFFKEVFSNDQYKIIKLELT